MGSRLLILAIGTLLVVTGSWGCVSTSAADLPARHQPFGADVAVFYVTGIGGVGSDCRSLRDGLTQAGFEGDWRVHDWTGGDFPLAALRNGRRQRAAARRLARSIELERRLRPDQRIVLVAHSGGAGVAVFALKRLSPGIDVDTVLLLAPALSRRYDLAPALARVSGAMVVFSSRHDGLVLGLGTSLFGTVEGVHGQAAGLTGFRRPGGVKHPGYQNLVHRPYREAWHRYGNDGGHFGALAKPFAAHVLAPMFRRPGEGAMAGDMRPQRIVRTPRL